MNHFAQRWLAIQCKIIGDCQSALLLMVKPDSQKLSPLAKWPLDSNEPSQLLMIAQTALNTRKNVIQQGDVESSDGQAFTYLAAPAFVNDKLTGVIALKMTLQPETKLQAIFKALEQGQQWLELASAERRIEPGKEFYPSIVKLAATCFDQNSYREVLVTLVTEVTQQFQCRRVAFGEIKSKHSEVVALSNSTNFDARANLLHSIADAMDEAMDQDAIIVYPPVDKQLFFNTFAHSELSGKYGNGAICTLPLVYQEKIFACLTLERDLENPFTPENVRLIEQTMALLSPYLQLKKAESAPLLERVVQSIQKSLANVISLEHVGFKLTGLAFLTILLLANYIQGDFRVHADAILEGKVQRVITAPMDGYILTAAARAGDMVKQDSVMAAMDDADLKLEAVKLASERQQVQREYREALAKRELPKVSVLSAKMAQIEAQQQLVDEQLQRTTIVAPFDGVVIDGDLSQLLGTPVERGKNLFKIAPLDGYRIILKVNERLISYVQQGQTGSLSLSSIPEKVYPLVVQKITALSKVEGGENIFRVEASLQNPTDVLRPGMAGVGKIAAGRQSLLWIWTHELVDWLRLWLWSWWP